MVDAACDTVIVVVPTMPPIVTSPDEELIVATPGALLLKVRAPSLALELANVNVESAVLFDIFEIVIVGVAFPTVKVTVTGVGA